MGQAEFFICDTVGQSIKRIEADRVFYKDQHYSQNCSFLPSKLKGMDVL